MAEPHGTYYFATGDLVLQVDDVLFKVHRYLLTQSSSVFRDMLEIPQGEQNQVEQQPILLTGDSVEGWSTFFELHYRDNPWAPPPTFSDQRMLALLRISHKYCMIKIQDEIITRMRLSASRTDQLINLIVAADIIGSKEIWRSTVEMLKVTKPIPTFEQSKLIGLEATYSILSDAYLHLNSIHQSCPPKW
ncbi:hypothetical protein FRC19_008259 [Serendipita sp. 401]|nr:hypothetical protein FRC15_011677 [Serendipita sp. 397]KAG8826653.1 hypothetical protein FRC19_008259 [Serendipita sp. 401]